MLMLKTSVDGAGRTKLGKEKQRKIICFLLTALLLVKRFTLETNSLQIFQVSETKIIWENTRNTGDNEECFRMNSESWVDGEIYASNTGDQQMVDDGHAADMILDIPDILENAGLLLGQSLAWKESRFLDLTFDPEKEADQETVRTWAVRLIYLVVHYHQHRHALEEMRYIQALTASNRHNCVAERQKRGKGNFDFECMEAKYLLSPNTFNGIGANRELIFQMTLMAGLAIDRVVIFTNYPDRWPLASCSRGDFQCFFAPPTPCVPTKEDIAVAHKLSRKDKAELFNTGSIPPDIQDYKVIISEPFPVRGHDEIFELGGRLVSRLQNISTAIINALPPDDRRLPMLRNATEMIAHIDSPRHLLQTRKINHALIFYALRPNAKYSTKMEEVLNRTIPYSFIPEESIGMPIRGSDKCNLESECLKFDQYMYVVDKTWKKFRNNRDLHSTGLTSSNASIVFTTEAPNVVQEQRAFVRQTSLKDKNYSYNFLTNRYDVLPGSGRGIGRARKNVTADEGMLSAMASFKLQLSTGITVANCCSKFHGMLFDFLSEGLGLAKSNTFRCLQEFDEPEYYLCCWKHPTCIARRDAAIKALANQM